MGDTDDVFAMAVRRAEAMAGQDEDALRQLLHPDFCWISHKGKWFDLQSYLESNQRGSNRWHSQELRDPDVRVVGHSAVLRCIAIDCVDVRAGKPETFSMSMARTWVRQSGHWTCLAGHAGPWLQNS